MIRNIYYLCPCNPLPSGGIQKIYQHVDALRAHGFSAYVLHQQKGYRYPWRKSDTPVAHFELNKKATFYTRQRVKLFNLPIGWDLLKDLSTIHYQTKQRKIDLPPLSQQDVIVIPDYLIYETLPLIRTFPTVILNFTAYFTFNGMTISDSINHSCRLPYNNEVLGCIVGSQDTANYLKFTFPQLSIYCCQFGVDSEQFQYNPHKKKQMAFMPRKCRNHLVQILNILKERNKIPGWQLVSLENMPQEKLVTTVQDSALYLSTSYEEGFGLPPAEALATGALVVGYDGEGGREYFKPPFAYSIPHGNIIQFVKQIEYVASLYERDHTQFVNRGKEASQYIRNLYSNAYENKSVVDAWKQIQTRMQTQK